jgi:hypothetical protein
MLWCAGCRAPTTGFQRGRAPISRLRRTLNVVCTPTALLAVLSVDVTARQAPQLTGRPGVFLDCNQCDFDHLRRIIPFVDWLRERTAADVHVLVTQQTTGAGGNSYELFFIGLGTLSSREDTIRVTTRQDETEDEVRASIAHAIALGLVPFAARTAAGARLTIGYDDAGIAQVTPAGVDPWNAWVFQLRLGGSLGSVLNNVVNPRMR